MPMQQSLTVLLRWDSALPVRRALELTNRKLDATNSAEHAPYYSIAVLIPMRIGKAEDPEKFIKVLREKATLKIRGKKISPERVDISARADGVVVYYLFPRSEAITAADKDVEFACLFGRMEIKTKFHPKEMLFGDKLEL